MYNEVKKNLIGGEWVETAEAQPNINPSNPNDIIAHYAWANAAQAQQALDAARAALPAWAAMLPQERFDILMRIARKLAENAVENGEMLAREEGKIRKDSIAEASRAAKCFEYFAGEIFRGKGEFHQGMRPGFNVTLDREPVGVVSIITPWNFPIAIPAWKIAAALAYGNTVVFKPSEVTPALAWILVEAAVEAGVPDGVLNMVCGRGIDLGDTLIAGANAVTFTGSVPVGRSILEKTAKTMTKTQLELGGKNPMVIANDADLEHATNTVLDSSFGSNGERCTASSRLIVEEGIYDDFVELMTAKVAAMKVGDALDPETTLGPIVNERQLNSVMNYVEIGKAEGAKIATGGERVETKEGGYFMQPTLFVDTDNKMRINQEEIFGPVASVIRAKDLDEAIALANDVDYGLSSGICTQDLSKAELFRRCSKAGMVMVNAPTAGVDFHVPFGGRDQSGFGGGEQGSASIDFFTERKTGYIYHGVS